MKTVLLLLLTLSFPLTGGTFEYETSKPLSVPKVGALVEKLQQAPDPFDHVHYFMKHTLAFDKKEIGLLFPTTKGKLKFYIDPNPSIKYMLYLSKDVTVAPALHFTFPL